MPATKWGHPQPPLSSTHACQHFSNMHEVLRLLHGWKSVESLALVTQNDVPDLKIPATKKDPLVLKKSSPPIFWDLRPFVPFLKHVILPFCYNFQETHLFFVTFGAFIVLGHIRLDIFIKLRRWLEVNPIVTSLHLLVKSEFETSGWARTFLHSRMHGNNCKHGEWWAMMGRVVATLLPATVFRPIKLVLSASPGYLLVPLWQHSHQTIFATMQNFCLCPGEKGISDFLKETQFSQKPVLQQ